MLDNFEWIKDIMRYGERTETYELDVNITEYVYKYNNKEYLITMKNGSIINIFQLA